MSDFMREEFEVWLRTRPEVLNIGFNKESGRYVLREDQERWEAWIASRECLVIDLPDEDGMQGHLWAPDVVAAMEAAGLKVKP